MQRTVITSFGAYGYNLYGRNFLETFDRFWPKDIRVVVFAEPDTPPLGFKWDDRELIVEPIGNVPHVTEFLSAIERFPVLCGDTPVGHKIFNDARSARATFMQAYGCERFGGQVIWLDADIVTHEPVTHEFLDSLLKPDQFCAYLGRREVFSENGFLALNAGHRIAKSFLQTYVKLYTSGAIFLEPGWNDCCAFDRVRAAAERGFPEAFNNLGKSVAYTKETQHVFINSVLGSVMDHLKGGRKNLGRSPLSDLAIPRKEPYWQEANIVGVQTR